MNKKIKFKSLSELWLEQATLGVTYTYKSNLESYVKHLNNAFGSQPVASIKPYDLDLLIRQLYICNPNTNKPSSKKLLVNIVNCANRIFDFAIENEVMYKNPAKNKKKSIPKNAPRKTVNALNSEQQQLVIETEHRAKTAAVIMMFMGLRTGEILALEWNDVDLDNYVVSVNKRLQRISGNKYVVSDGTKNGESRTVTIPHNLGNWLREQKSNATSYLVAPSRSGELQSPTMWKRLWESYQNEINYNCYVKKCIEKGQTPAAKYAPTKTPQVIAPFNAHQLRHTYATLLYISGVDVKTASQLLGHSSINITLEIYTHLDKQFKSLNIQKFDNYIKSDLDIDKI